eukprot:7382837-Prymnesium_polylepis.1
MVCRPLRPQASEARGGARREAGEPRRQRFDEPGGRHPIPHAIPHPQALTPTLTPPTHRFGEPGGCPLHPPATSTRRVRSQLEREAEELERLLAAKRKAIAKLGGTVPNALAKSQSAT